MKKLTAAQQRYLEEIRAAGTKRYNGRARRSLEALKAAGLIDFEYDLVPHQTGNGLSFTELFIATAVTS